MLTDLLNLSVSYQFDFTILKNNLRFPIIFQRILPQKRLKIILDLYFVLDKFYDTFNTSLTPTLPDGLDEDRRP